MRYHTSEKFYEDVRKPPSEACKTGTLSKQHIYIYKTAGKRVTKAGTEVGGAMRAAAIWYKCFGTLYGSVGWVYTCIERRGISGYSPLLSTRA